MGKIKIAIVGYGNLGRGVENAIGRTDDIEVIGVFSRRPADKVETLGATVYSMEELINFKDKVDVAILCGGSATDLIEQAPEIAKNFNIVDSFDTHAKIPEYFDKLNKISSDSGFISIISTGWDPGLFSINRVIADSILPKGESYTFWGKGVSQGHSDAIRRIEGVKLATQYTIPKEEIIDKIRAGEKLNLSTRDKHSRQCFVVANDSADKEKITNSIVTMPNYFDEYDTEVNFISEEEFKAKHSGMPHGGVVIHRADTSENITQVYEFKLTLDSNPEFTASVTVACARALPRLKAEGKKGTFTIFDIPVSYMSPHSNEYLRANFL